MKAVVERAVRDEPSLHPLRRFHTVIACASGWLVYGPVGLKYLTFLLLACSGLVLLGRTSRWQDLRRIDFAAPAAALWLVLALACRTLGLCPSAAAPAGNLPPAARLPRSPPASHAPRLLAATRVRREERSRVRTSGIVACPGSVRGSSRRAGGCCWAPA